MGQSSSQAHPPQQQIELAGTPTPDLSTVDADDDALSQPAVVELQPPKVTKTAPAKIRPKKTRKRTSDNSQRRLRSPQLAQIKAPAEMSEEELQPPRKKRKSLPKAARIDDEAQQVKQEPFSPLRKAKPRAQGRSRTVPSSPPQVVISTSEVEVATQAQALNDPVGALQGRLSGTKEQASRDGSNITAEGQTPLVQLQQPSSDFLSKTDEPLAEAAASQEPAIVVGMKEPVKDHGEVQQQNDTPMRLQGDPNPEQDIMEDTIGDEMKTSDTWPAHLVPEQHEIAERCQQRTLTFGDLEMEQLFKHPMNKLEHRENSRKAARNVLRGHIVNWDLERCVYKGLAKYVEDENGEVTIVYAAKGEKFPTPHHSKAAKREAKATKRFLRSTREALHASLVMSELEAEKFANEPALDDTASDQGLKSAEAFDTAQLTNSSGGAEADAIDDATGEDVGLVEPAEPRYTEHDEDDEDDENEGVIIEEQANDETLDVQQRKEALGEGQVEHEIETMADNARLEAEDGPDEAEEGEGESQEQKVAPGHIQNRELDAEAEPTLEAPVRAQRRRVEIVGEESDLEVDEEKVDATGEQDETMKEAETRDRGPPAIGEEVEGENAHCETTAKRRPKSRTVKAQSRKANNADPLTKRQEKVTQVSTSRPGPAPAPATTREQQSTPAAHAPIPTPPQSQNTQQGQTGAPHPTMAQVKDWLVSQYEEPPLPPDELAAKPAKTVARKRKPKSSDDDAEFNLPESEAAPEGDHDVAATSAPPKTKKKRAKKTDHTAKTDMSENIEDVSRPSKAKKRKLNEAQSAEPKRRVTMSGPYTHEEQETADNIFMRVLDREGLHEADLIAQIKNWKTCCVSFKTAMFDAFSDRTVDSVRKFCQRRWHGQQRGPWTQEEDDALRAAHASQPGKWTVISDSVGRSAQDCKDRWRNHLEFGPKTVGPWTVEEEEKLMAAVEECIDIIKKEKSDDLGLIQDPERLATLVNWGVVSQKFHGQRYPARCREKYANMIALGRNRTHKRKSGTSSLENRGDEDPRHILSARRIVDGFEIGDYYDVFVEIHSSFDDPHQHFRDDKHMMWSIVSTKNLHSRFALYSKPSCLRRVALERAIATWPANNAKIRKRLASVDTMPAKALVLAEWVEKTNAGRLDSMTRTYRPELMGKSKEELSEMKQARKKEYLQRRKKYDKSEAYVHDSEDDEVDGNDENDPIDSHEAHVPSAVLNEGGDETPSEDSNEEVEDEALTANKESGDDEEEEDDGSSQVTQEVPASQFLPSQTLPQDDDIRMADVESLQGTPNISPSGFVNRLKSSGSSRRKTVGYSKKNAFKAKPLRQSGF